MAASGLPTKELSSRGRLISVFAALIALTGILTLGRDQICRLFVPVLFENDQPIKADIIYVLGGDYGLRGPLAAGLLRKGWAQKILMARQKEAAGESANETDLLRKTLYECGVKQQQIAEARPPGGVDSTADEARALKAYAVTNPMNAVLVVTSSFHGHRARLAMERALERTGVQIRVITAESKFASRERWRENEIGRMQIESESIKMIYYFLTFFG